MNYRMIFRLCALCLLIEAGFLIIPLIYSICTGENIFSLLITIIIIVAISLPIILFLKPITRTLYARDGLFIAGAIWVFISIFGALPFYFSGMFKTYIDCFFETVSGFTTTGASILTQVENLPRGILMWRSLTNWLGGMGVLVLLLAILPTTEVDMRSMCLLRAESPGPIASKLVPKMSNTAKILYIIYLSLTVLTIIALIIAGMPVYDSVLHSWSAAGTGGFSPKNASIAFYNSTPINIICTISMLLFSFNFMVFFNVIMRQFKAILKDSEFLFYISLVFISIVAISININSLYPSIFQSIEHAAFQVATMISTTGFASTDFNQWPTFTKSVMMLLMILGGCAGSTAGGIKAIRTVILFKAARREIGKQIHPRAISPVKINGRAIDESKVMAVQYFFVLYIIIIIFSTLIISFDGFDFLSTFSAVLATFNNIGPGFGIVGPVGNFSEFSQFSKVVMSIGMLLGRLEIFPIFILFAPYTLKMHRETIFLLGNRILRKR